MVVGTGGEVDNPRPSLKTKNMFSEDFIKKAKEMADNNSQIIGIYFSLPAEDREHFKDRFEKVVNKSHDIIKNINDDQLRRMAIKLLW